ncbi:unnamed protein product [Allacma fusca]|uniref:Uncharacterized protein n=1 Tax=Allacma fusca TaxID=39272 RepID=A0A8J2LNZ8_9HEXA|nr:unnamed protein product [Allacma fusca]
MTKIVSHLLIIWLFGLTTVDFLHVIASSVITAKNNDTDLITSVARAQHFVKKRQLESKPDFHSKTVDPNLIAKLARAKLGASHRFRRAGAHFEEDAVTRDLETTQVETAEAAIDAEQAKDSSIEALLASSKLQQDLEANPNLHARSQNETDDSSDNEDENDKQDEDDQEDDSDHLQEYNHDDEDREEEDENDDSANDEDDHKDVNAHEIIVEDDDVTVKDLDIDLNTKGDQTGKGEDKNNKYDSDIKHRDKEHSEKEHEDKDKKQGSKDEEHGDKDKKHGSKDEEHGDTEKKYGDKDKKHGNKDDEHKDKQKGKGDTGPSVCQGLLDFKRMSDDFRSRLQHLIEQEEDVVKRLENWEKSLEDGPDEPSKRRPHKKGSTDNKKHSKPKTKACVIVEEDDEPKPGKKKPKPHSREKAEKGHSKNHKSMSSDEQKGIPIVEAHIRSPEESVSNRRHGYRRFRTKKSRKVIRESDPRTHKDISGDIDLENIYWVKPNNYNSPSDSEASKDVLNKIYKNGQDVLIIPISSKFRNTREVAESFLESFSPTLHKTKRNAGGEADEDTEPKSILNWNKGSKVTEAQNANEKMNKKFKMTIRRV